MSYKSPIDIIYGDIQIEVEDNVVKAIQGFNIDIDKDELIKALNYDREQYKAGYKDGYKDALEEISMYIDRYMGKLHPQAYNERAQLKRLNDYIEKLERGD